MDIAILTNNVSRCAWYQEESQNVKERYYCSWTPPEGWEEDAINDGEEDGNVEEEDEDARRNTRATSNGQIAPITEEGCREAGGFWTRVEPFGLPPPICEESVWSRDNHLGNTIGGYPAKYLHHIHSFSQIAMNATSGRWTNHSSTECWLR